MRRLTAMLVLCGLAAGCGEREETVAATDETVAPAPSPSPTETATATAEPDLAACPPSRTFEGDLMERTGPLPVPTEFAGMVKSDMNHFAIISKAGNTFCVDTGWMDRIEDAKISHDQRFLAFGWLGYEQFGYVVIDRSGKGQVIDTGNAPLSPPNGKRFAAVDLSVSGFGSLNAFAVWDIRPIGLRQLAMVSDGLPDGDWRIDGWKGNDCVRLSLLPLDRHPADYSDFQKAPRDPWFASAANRWRPEPGTCPAG